MHKVCLEHLLISILLEETLSFSNLCIYINRKNIINCLNTQYQTHGSGTCHFPLRVFKTLSLSLYTKVPSNLEVGM